MSVIGMSASCSATGTIFQLSWSPGEFSLPGREQLFPASVCLVIATIVSHVLEPWRILSARQGAIVSGNLLLGYRYYLFNCLGAQEDSFFPAGSNCFRQPSAWLYRYYFSIVLEPRGILSSRQGAQQRHALPLRTVHKNS